MQGNPKPQTQGSDRRHVNAGAGKSEFSWQKHLLINSALSAQAAKLSVTRFGALPGVIVDMHAGDGTGVQTLQRGLFYEDISIVIGGASQSSQTPEWRPPYRWIEALVRDCDAAGVKVYFKTNLGIANRLLQLPFDAPLREDPQQAPQAFHYLKIAKASS